MSRVLALGDLSHLLSLSLYRISAGLLSPGREERLARKIGDLDSVIRGRRRALLTSRVSALLGNERDPAEIDQITEEVFRQRWVEGFSFSAVHRKNLSRWVTIEGLDRLQEGLNNSRGVILWESLFGKRLWASAALVDQGFSLCQVHADEHGASSDTWLGRKGVRGLRRRGEAKLFSEIIDIQDDSLAYLRPVISRLKQNGIVLISGVGGKGHKFVSVDFMGAQCQFPTGAVSLAKMTGASILPIFCFSDEHGVNRVVLEPPIDLEQGLDRDDTVGQAVKQYSGLLEGYIRKYPAQWYQWRYSSIESFLERSETKAA